MTDFGRRIPWNALLADGEPGRVFRVSRLVIENGTDPNTIKCEIDSQFNGHDVAQQDNIAKGATTGVWTLSSNGLFLDILQIHLGGVVLYARALFGNNASLTNVMPSGGTSIKSVRIIPRATGDQATHDWTAICDDGKIVVDIIYITAP